AASRAPPRAMLRPASPPSADRRASSTRRWPACVSAPRDDRVRRGRDAHRARLRARRRSPATAAGCRRCRADRARARAPPRESCRYCTSRITGMRLRQLNIGCFGGGTGLPSLLGGLKHNPWLHLNAVVTMFDSGGSSGQLRDELGVLPPGDILKCALALARNSREARRVLLARLPTLEHARLGGHTGGHLLLSVMQPYSGGFLDAIDGLRALLGCRGRVWPVSVQSASVCAEYGDGKTTRGEVEVDAGQTSGQFVRRIWLEPPVSIHPTVAKAITEFDAIIIGPGSFYTSLMPIFRVRGGSEPL